MSGSAMFYAALRAYAENERIDREMHSELIELMQGVREEAMQDGKAIANQSRYSREEDLRMFALHQAVQSCGEHPSDVVHWARKFVEYVKSGGVVPAEKGDNTIDTTRDTLEQQRTQLDEAISLLTNLTDYLDDDNVPHPYRQRIRTWLDTVTTQPEDGATSE